MDSASVASCTSAPGSWGEGRTARWRRRPRGPWGVCARSGSEFFEISQPSVADSHVCGQRRLPSSQRLTLGFTYHERKTYYGGKRQRKAENKSADRAGLEHGHCICDPSPERSAVPKAARKDPLGRPVAAGRAPARPSRPGAGLPLSPARAPAGAPAPATVPPGVRTSCCPRFPGPDLLVPAHPCRMQMLALGHSMCASEGGAGALRLGIPPCPVLTMLPPPPSLPPTRRAPPRPRSWAYRALPAPRAPRPPPPDLETGAGVSAPSSRPE